MAPRSLIEAVRTSISPVTNWLWFVSVGLAIGA